MDSLKRLHQVVKKKIGDKKFVVVSHSEPYVHYYEQSERRHRKTSGGLVAALDPVMRACNGTWVAYAAGDADMEVVGKEGSIRVPPSDDSKGAVRGQASTYLLNRLPLFREEVEDYLDGASNSSLWPWCHFAYVRPSFDEHCWQRYRDVNRKFAQRVLNHIGKEPAFVWLQDYHLSLAAKYIKEKRPDVVTAQFWHIPWPNPETFKVCPWGREIVESLLYNDLLGFQIRYYANNFLDAVDQTLQARIDREQSRVHFQRSSTLVRDFPISIDWQRARKAASSIKATGMEAVRRKFGLFAPRLAIGVDRLDYTKGLAEKMLAVDAFLSQNRNMAGKFTLVQIASPTRQHVPHYWKNAKQVSKLVDDINFKWGAGKWKPIVFLNQFVPFEDITALYRMSELCIVTSLHDGMNLVSKEYVAAKPDGNGVLLLSKFTGASRELPQALPINPYSVGGTADSIKKALSMPLEERRERMKKMAQHIAENDVYKWAADFIDHIAKLESTVV